MKISLKAARVNAEMTQEEVGKALKLSRDSIKAIEKGTREVRVGELDILCLLYKCTRDDIFLPYESANGEIIKNKQVFTNKIA